MAGRAAQTRVQEKHPTLYRPDGDIVLSAPLSPTSVQLFRVHKAFLSVHSPVFRDVLSLPVGNTPNVETYDDVPLIELSDDVKDLAGLLSAIYNPACVIFH